MNDIGNLINLAEYPLLNSGREDLVTALKTEFAATGACCLRNFLRPEALAKLQAEAQDLAPMAYAGPLEATPYFFNYDQDGDAELSMDHPRRRRSRRALAQVAADLIPKESGLRELHHSPLLQDFLAEILDLEALYILDDPYQCLNISVMQPGGCQQWHFDAGRFVITLLLQAPEGGGDFEYAPFIRSEAAENFDAVKAVMDGDTDLLTTVPLQAGTLMLFAGHYSLHHVTEVTGVRARLQSIFAYSPKPGVKGSYESSRRHYGERVQPY